MALPPEQPIDIRSADGFLFGGCTVPARGTRRGGLILIQEIFGVTDHIRELADHFAGDGFEVIAPSLFDRQERAFDVDYRAANIARARELADNADWDKVTLDLQACADRLEPPVFAIGYCWGGTAAWVAACRVRGLAAAAGYYGRLIVDFLDETPQCPIILHFGEKDPTIPMENVERIKQAHPDVPVYMYPAGHGFNSDRRADYDAESTRLARQRTLEFFAAHSG
ncbi:MAG: dienelactone hydrolase family protein [Alphaproteobacteria bacterium]